MQEQPNFCCSSDSAFSRTHVTVGIHFLSRDNVNAKFLPAFLHSGIWPVFNEQVPRPAQDQPGG